MLAATTLNTTPTSAYTGNPSAVTGGSASAGISFNHLLASANGGESLSKHVFRNGRVSVDMHADGKRINNVSYYDESGQKLTTSGFWPQDILRNCEKFSIPLTDFKDVGQQLDAASVGYRPYEQFAGTGSNHGIDFDNLAAGGMGTAYDWTADPLVHLKGPAAANQLRADQALAERLGLKTPAAGAASTSSAVIATSASVVPASAQPAVVASSKSNNQTLASSVAALDELLQLITQVKASLQSPVPTAVTPSTPTASATASSATSTVAANTTNETAAQPVGNSNTAQRLAQMKSLLDLLIAAR